MAKQFWVNNYFIDVPRNQIKHQQQSTPLPPKALKVLEVLASRAGEVVSHDELMDLVWENSVVGPNTLQRAIAQLRKAFGDDSKHQAFIKTHAKKGYSLEANVRWEGDNPQRQELSATTQTAKFNMKLILAISALAVLTLFIVWDNKTPIYDQVTPLTASDEQEFNASYSPDGRYLVFNRLIDMCSSHLWAKDLSNNKEVRLSDEAGHYSGLSWSVDGTQLAYILQSDCADTEPNTTQCWQLQTIDFAQAWSGNPNNLMRFDCSEKQTTHPKWLNDGRIAMLQYMTSKSKPELVIYDPIADNLDKLPLSRSGEVYTLDYSRTADLLAVVILTADNKHILQTLNSKGAVQSESEIQPLPHHSIYDTFPINFAPDGKHFLTGVNGQVYQLDLDGNLNRVHPDTYTNIGSAVFHPNQHKFAVVYGPKDFDIGTLQVEDTGTDINITARSNSPDLNAQFQPNGNLVAFSSSRSGKNQLWIKEGDSTYQLTQFADGLASTRFSWSPDGQRLAVNVNNQLVLITLEGIYQVIDTPFEVYWIMRWTDPDRLLFTASHTKKYQLFSIDVESGDVQDLELSNIAWAAYTKDNELVFSDFNVDFWKLSENGKSPIEALNSKLFSKYVLLKNGFMFGINSQNQFWRYSLETKTLHTLAKLDENILYVSDVNHEQFLATKFTGGRRELMEFSQ